MVIPHPVAGIALLLFLGRRSTVGGILSHIGLEFVSHVPGIVAAMLFVSVPILVSGAREAFRGVDPQLERVARTLGDTAWGAFRRVTLPLAEGEFSPVPFSPGPEASASSDPLSF